MKLAAGVIIVVLGGLLIAVIQNDKKLPYYELHYDKQQSTKKEDWSYKLKKVKSFSYGSELYKGASGGCYLYDKFTHGGLLARVNCQDFMEIEDDHNL